MSKLNISDPAYARAYYKAFMLNPNITHVFDKPKKTTVPFNRYTNLLLLPRKGDYRPHELQVLHKLLYLFLIPSHPFPAMGVVVTNIHYEIADLYKNY
jgi:hypothetical protein